MIKLEFKEYGTVEWVEIHKIINDQVSNGEVIFKDPKDAKTAFEELKAKYELRMSTAKGRTLSTNLKVIFRWLSGTSERRGLIKYENWEIAALVTQQMKNLMFQEKRVLDGSKIQCELGKKTPGTIMVSNLSNTTDDVSLKKFFKKRFPSYKILTACIFRQKDFRDTLAEGQDEITLEETIKNLADSPNDIVKFEVLPHKENDKNKISHRAELFTKNEEFANHLIQNLDQKVGFIGKGRVHVELSRSRTWRMDMRTYEVLKDELGNKIRELQKKLGESAEIAILGGEEAGQQSKKNKYQSPALRIRSGSKLKLEYLMSQFQKILLGYSYHLNNKAEIQKMSRKEGSDFCKKLQAELNTKIDLIKSQALIKILGSPANIEKAKLKIESYLNKENYYSQVIDFGGLNVRNLLKKDQELLKNIIANCPQVAFDLKLSQKKLTLTGPQKFVDEAYSLIMSTVEKNQNTDDKDGYLRVCPHCLDDMVQGYRLELCGHKLCTKCIEGHVRQTLSDGGSFPINCPVCEHYPQPISLADLRNNVPENILAKLWERSYAKFIEKNSTTYRKCHGIGCVNVYLVDDPKNPEVHCAMCFLRYCRKCQEEPPQMEQSTLESMLGNWHICKVPIIETTEQEKPIDQAPSPIKRFQYKGITIIEDS